MALILRRGGSPTPITRLLTGIVIAVLLSTGSGVAGAFEDCGAAYDRQEYAEALRLCRPLAEQGDAQAQSNLGYMYAQGQGVAQDKAVALVWLSLAAAQGFEAARSARDRLAANMTPDQIAEAQRLAREWKPTR